MSLEAFQLTGKNALVTGSHKGLGAAIAVALADAGANVGCHGRDSKPGKVCDDILARGRKTFYFAGDVADGAVCAGLIEKTVAEFGSIDILVNNAGTIRRAPAVEYPMEQWNEVIAVNLTSVFRLSQLAGQQMIKQGKGGKIVNIASLLSFQGGILVPAYAAAKGGVAQLTKALSNEWAAKNIRQILERIPAGRWGEPGDLAGAAVFLCSPASDYIHGHVLVVDGGLACAVRR